MRQRQKEIKLTAVRLIFFDMKIDLLKSRSFIMCKVKQRLDKICPKNIDGISEV